MGEFYVIFIDKDGKLVVHESDDILVIVRFLIKAQPKQFEVFFGTFCDSMLQLYCQQTDVLKDDIDELRAVVDLEQRRLRGARPDEEEPQDTVEVVVESEQVADGPTE